MDVFLSDAFLSSLLRGSLIAALPLILAGLGEQLSERAGLLNLGIEGVMMFGAYIGFFVALNTDSFWLGFIAALALGSVLGLIIALLCVRLGMNQIIVGISVTLTATGLTALLHHFQFSRTYPRLDAAETLPIPGLSSLPTLGNGLFNHHPLIYIGLLLPLVFGFIYRYTFFGLNLASAGEKPEALDAAGVNVARTRTIALMIGCSMSAVAGAFLSEIGSGIFVPHMTNGTGYIAMVLAMLARGKASWVLAGSLLFGACLSATTALQVAGINVSTDIIAMLPFAMVMVVLLLFGKRARMPSALGSPYQRGVR